MLPGFITDDNLKPDVIPAIGDISCESLCRSQYEGCTLNCVELARTCRRGDRWEICWDQVEGCHDACEGSRGFCQGSCHNLAW